MFENEFLREESESLSSAMPESAVLTVLGFFQNLYGMKAGFDAYERLRSAAVAFAAYDNMGGKPGILFNDDGGEFVSLDDIQE